MGVWCSCWASSFVAPPFCGDGGGKVDCGTLLIGGLPLMLILHPYLQFGSIWGVKFLDFLSFSSLPSSGLFWLCFTPEDVCIPWSLCFYVRLYVSILFLHACTPAVICAARALTTMTLMSTAPASSRLRVCVCVLHSELACVCHAPLDRVLELMNATAAGLNWMLLVVFSCFLWLKAEQQIDIFQFRPMLFYSKRAEMMLGRQMAAQQLNRGTESRLPWLAGWWVTVQKKNKTVCAGLICENTCCYCIILIQFSEGLKIISTHILATLSLWVMHVPPFQTCGIKNAAERHGHLTFRVFVSIT